MSDNQFDVHDVFAPANYLYFYETLLIDERTDREVDLIFIRFLTFPEIADWPRQAGFRTITGYDQNGGEHGVDSLRMIVVAEK